MTDCESFLAQLTAVCAYLGRISVQGEGGAAHVWLHAVGGRNLAFEGSLDDLLHAVQSTDAEGLYPDESSLSGKLKLFSVHLEEALDTAPDGARHLGLRSYGVVAV